MHFSFQFICLHLISQKFVMREGCWGRTRFSRWTAGLNGVTLSSTFFPHPLNLRSHVLFPESLCLIFTSYNLNWSYCKAQSLSNIARGANIGITRSPEKGEKGFASLGAAELWAEPPMVKSANFSGKAYWLRTCA